MGKKRDLITATILITLLLANCSLFPAMNQPMEVIIRSSTLSVAWDPPQLNPGDIDKTFTGYRFYARRLSGLGSTLWGGAWILVGTVPYSENPEFTVTSEFLDYGKYEFAVSAVRADDSETGKHASTESSADPPTGWYVFWIGSE